MGAFVTAVTSGADISAAVWELDPGPSCGVPSSSALGTMIHECIARAEYPHGDRRAAQAVDNWLEVVRYLGLTRILKSEAPCSGRTKHGEYFGYADFVCQDRAERTLLIELKTGLIRPTAALQVAAYGKVLGIPLENQLVVSVCTVHKGCWNLAQPGPKAWSSFTRAHGRCLKRDARARRLKYANFPEYRDRSSNPRGRRQRIPA